MAILHRPTLLLATALLVALLSIPTTSSRPCKTLFITFSIEPLHPNPNNFIFPDPQSLFSDQITTTNELFIIDRPGFISYPNFEFDRSRLVQEKDDETTPLMETLMDREGIDFDSVMERSKDVLSVVVALLFGVGCGALTAACMYFVWVLVAGAREEHYDDEDEEKEEFLSVYDQIPSPKKGEYVKIPQADVAQAKEVV